MAFLLIAALVLPILGIVLQAALPRPQIARWLGLASSVGSALIALFFVLGFYFEYVPHPFPFGFEWIPAYSVNYVYRLDGFNGPIFLATTLIFPISLVAEWNQGRGRRGLHSLILLLQTATMGTLLADDLFLQFFFFSLMLVPTYFIVAIWGKSELAEKIGARLIATCAIAHALIFFGILLLYYSVEPHSYMIAALAAGKLSSRQVVLFGMEFSVQKVAFCFITLGFALRTPIWPFHGWLSAVVRNTPSGILAPIVAVSAPTGVAIYSRMLYQLFPEILQAYQGTMMTVGLVCFIFPIITLISQEDHRSIAQKFILAVTGLAITGMASMHVSALSGLVLILFSTCLAAGGYFSVSEFLKIRTDTYEIGRQGGVLHRYPLLAICFSIFCASWLAIPGSVGFVGGSLLQIGEYQYHWGVAMAVLFSFLMATAFCIRAFYQVFLGAAAAVQHETALSLRETVCLIPPVIGIIIFGILPSPLLTPAKEITLQFLERIVRAP